eukprot:5999799-Pyramimonas_sp.AAC.1
MAWTKAVMTAVAADHVVVLGRTPASALRSSTPHMRGIFTVQVTPAPHMRGIYTVQVTPAPHMRGIYPVQ